MRVKVADVLSSPRPVNGGAPQGSCAGVQMYSGVTDDIDSNLPEPDILGSNLRATDPDWSFVDHQPQQLPSLMLAENITDHSGPICFISSLAFPSALTLGTEGDLPGIVTWRAFTTPGTGAPITGPP